MLSYANFSAFSEEGIVFVCKDFIALNNGELITLPLDSAAEHYNMGFIVHSFDSNKTCQYFVALFLVHFFLLKKRNGKNVGGGVV